MAQSLETLQDELTRRHRAAVLAIACVAALTLLLMLVAYAGLFEISSSLSPALGGALRIAIVVFGLGAVVMRRTMFSTMRLKDIAALRGTSALLETLQKTTIYVALLAAAIAVMGYVVSLASGEWTDMAMLGAIAIAVLLYAYPRRAAWRSVLQLARQTRPEDAPAAKGTIA